MSRAIKMMLDRIGELSHDNAMLRQKLEDAENRILNDTCAREAEAELYKAKKEIARLQALLHSFLVERRALERPSLYCVLAYTLQ